MKKKFYRKLDNHTMKTSLGTMYIISMTFLKNGKKNISLKYGYLMILSNHSLTYLHKRNGSITLTRWLIIQRRIYLILLNIGSRS